MDGQDVQLVYNNIVEQLSSSDVNNNALYFLENIVSLGIVKNIEKNSDGDLLIQLRGSSVKLDSINETIKIATTINTELARKEIPLIREWVHRIKHLHPNIDSKISDLMFFKPISEDTGSTYLANTQDTQSLSLKDWNTNSPKAIRQIVLGKLSDNTRDMIQPEDGEGAYEKLNKAMVNNLSTEYYRERLVGTPTTPALANKSVLNNDYHVVGDYTYHDSHVNSLKLPLMSILMASFTDAVKLINYINPISNSAIVEDITLKVNIEGNSLDITVKGDRNINPSTVVNDSILVPNRTDT